jgi:hypothetical protein
MEKEIKNIEDAQKLKSELERFKEEQRKLMEQLKQQGIDPLKPTLEPINSNNQESVANPISENTKNEETLEQVSPSTFDLGDIEIPAEPDLMQKQVEKEAQEKVKEIKPTPSFSQPEISNSPKLATSKADLALLTLEEELLTDSVEIFLPGLKENVVVKPLKSVEELNLKTQNLSFATFLRQLNVTLMTKTHIKNIPLTNYFKTVEDFENRILPVDRVLLIFGLIKNSFEKIADFSMICENCQREFLASPRVENLYFKFDIDKDTVLNTDYYTLAITKKFLNGKLEIDFGFNPEAVRMKLVKYKSNQEIKENLNDSDNILDATDNLTLFIKKIRVYKPDKRTKEGRKLVTEIDYYQDGFDEIFKFIHEMPMKLKDMVLSSVDLSDLEKYSPVFKVQENCPYCGHVHDLDVSPEIEFFRKTLSLLS